MTDDHHANSKLDIYERMLDAEDKAEKTNDLYLRVLAEIQNLKKRYAKEKQELTNFANESLVKELLAVIDSLDKSIEFCDSSDNIQAIKEGIEITRQILINALGKVGLKEVDSIDKPFDPNFHEALFELHNPDKDAGIVVKELQKGYTLNNRLIRAAKVAVNK